MLLHVMSRAVDRFRLHEGGDVHLDRLEDAYVILDGDLLAYGVAGFALPALGGEEASPERPAAVMIDRAIRDDARRIVYAHEVGHLLLGHVGSLALKEFSALWHEKQEAQAWAAAALLLIPTERCLGGETVAEIAAICRVPVGLAERHPALAHVRTGRRAA